MQNSPHQALAATAALRRSAGWANLSPREQAQLEANLRRVEQVLGNADGPRPTPATDPFAVPLETPANFRASLDRRATTPQPRGPAPQPAPATPNRPVGTEVIGDRARNALDAIDFPEFVAGLVQGTFQAIVDASAQQVRQYADLVASLAGSLDEFTKENVTANQARDHLADKHPRDLQLLLPRPGESTEPRLVPRRSGESSPAWLKDYGLDGAELTEELAEGALLRAGRRTVGQERMQALSTMVLMGINRVVVDKGSINARLMFHASARERYTAEVAAGQKGAKTGIQERSNTAAGATQTMVSTVSVNAQADTSIRASLMGEVKLEFRTETFNLDQFATTPAIQLINQHARPLAEKADAAATNVTPTDSTGDGGTP